MATFSESALPRKRIATYGKTARRTLPSYDHSISGQGSKLSRPDELDAPLDDDDFDDFARAPAVKKPAPVRPSKDIFDFPASDDEVEDIERQKKKRKLGTVAPLRDEGSSESLNRNQLGLKRTATGSSQTTERMGLKSPKKSTKPLLAKPRPKLQPPMEIEQRSPAKTNASPVRVPKITKMAPSPKGALRKPESPVKRAERLPSKTQSAPQPATATRRLKTPDPQIALKPAVSRETADRRALSRSTSTAGSSGSQGTAIRTGGLPKTPNRDARAGSSEVPTPAAVLTPRGRDMWDELLGLDEAVSQTSQHRVSGGDPKDAKRPARKRLIDALSEQTTRPSSVDYDSGDMLGSLPDSQPMVELSQLSRDQASEEEASSQNNFANPSKYAAVIAQKLQSSGPKFTYGSQRTILTEDVSSSQDIFDIPLDAPASPDPSRRRRGSISNITQLPTYEEDPEDRSKGTIRSVHELRQAGATNRLVDEVEDLLDRIGRPGSGSSSARRSGLIELYERLASKDFSRTFRDNACEQRLFVQLGKEADAIAGSLILSLLLQLLVDGSSLQTIALLQHQGVAALISRLLDLSQPIQTIAKARSSNMSRMAQGSLLAHEKSVLRLSIWDDAQPPALTPRTLSLKCLEVMVRRLRESGDRSDFISKDLTQKLFDILSPSPEDDEETDDPLEASPVDFELALSTLESHSVRGIGSTDESLWIKRYIPIVSRILLRLLHQTDKLSQRLLILALRLTLNVTNNNMEASEVAATRELSRSLGQTIASRFTILTRGLGEEERLVAVDQLILSLGVLINFAEWCPASRQHFRPPPDDSTLDGLIDVFLEKQEGISEAESVEEVMENVALGYLAVFLGFLAMSPVIERHLRERQPTKSLRPLVNSIEEFIHHNKRVDEALELEDDGSNAQTRLTDRLERMVQELKMKRG